MFDIFTADGIIEKGCLGCNEGDGGNGRNLRISIYEKERMIKGFNFRDGEIDGQDADSYVYGGRC